MKRLAAAYPEEMGHYSDDLWGLTASDGPEKYMDWGSPYKDPRLRPWRGVDGTLVPSAPGGSLAFRPWHSTQWSSRTGWTRRAKLMGLLPATSSWICDGSR